MDTHQKEDSTIRFSVSLQQNLLDELDNRIIKNGYSSRSELVRDMIREKLVEDNWKEDNPSDETKIAVLVVIYDHHQRELNQRMIDIQHDSNTHVLCTTHIHMDTHNCLETIILQGSSAEIQRLQLEIGGLRGVKFSKLTKASSFERDE
ncbi:nickel-responsive transcriptional regulator NikR [Helicobacter cetorum]|uniref:Putative nickel-responsive regulator n=1 Tax=Helicobacter cetorum (strain ATCC BAA-540 / CCUG 52418 / MIT 99-5656) TaxID=1163745 RepID=I0ESR0_HELCM|nr:nickel-responsive transcriptional regulator NikR [Helicobacter cetorum]AFI05979.1 nickel responsive regulator [Helicobacter cetorum MIT 99-5656]